MKNDVKTLLDEYREKTEEVLKDFEGLGKGLAQSRVFESMGYSLLAGGKRIRPALMMLFCRLCMSDVKKCAPFAAALEMIHTYSLIHDDLPCMDDDDMRRGKAANHKVYGEGMAMLAGDALLGFAFEYALENGVKCGNSEEVTLEAVKLLARYSGVYGMLGGQVIDVENGATDLESLLDMYEKKTACLLEAAAEIGVLVGGGRPEQMAAAKEYAKNVGIAFQICDDILDVESDAATLGKPTGSDAENGKVTAVTLLGLDGAREKAKEYSELANKVSAHFAEGFILRELTEYLLERKK